jgi:nucleoside-diphosphate-sugar epimerase
VFVTGANGFIGRALVERYRALGSEVTGVDLQAGDDAAVVQGDITAAGPWQRHAEGADLVIHTAALVGMYSSPQGYWEANVVAVRRALDAAVAGGAQRFVHLSSIVVFGFDFEGEVDETTPVRPNGVHYVDTKIASEQVVLAAHADGQLPCTIVRPGDVYGPRSRPWTIEPVRLLKAGQLVLPAGGRGLHSPVYVDDLVDGIGRAAAVPEAAGRIFTVTGAEAPAIGDFFAHYARMLGKDRPRSVPYGVARTAARVMDRAARLRGGRSELTPAAIDYTMRRGTYSIARARDVLGYEPAVSVAEGMRRTEEWLRSADML